MQQKYHNSEYRYYLHYLHGDIASIYTKDLHGQIQNNLSYRKDKKEFETIVTRK